MSDNAARPGFTIIESTGPPVRSSEQLFTDATESASVELDCSDTLNLIVTHKMSVGAEGYVALWQQLSSDIISLSKVLNVVTAKTRNPHGLISGESVTIEDVVPTSYNGTFTVTVVDDYTFTYST